MWYLQALQEIHKRGIVHNDIKEPNIIWNSTTSSIHLIDFGCATATSGETQSHTPGYNAPDHIKTPASDVYSAGIVLMNVVSLWQRKGLVLLISLAIDLKCCNPIKSTGLQTT